MDGMCVYMLSCGLLSLGNGRSILSISTGLIYAWYGGKLNAQHEVVMTSQ